MPLPFGRGVFVPYPLERVALRIMNYELYPLLPPQFFLRFAMRSASPLIRAIASLKKAAEPSD